MRLFGIFAVGAVMCVHGADGLPAWSGEALRMGWSHHQCTPSYGPDGMTLDSRGLDPFVTADLYETIFALNEDGMAIIMVSHDVNAAIRYSRHILHIGDTVFYGTTAAYLESEPGLDFLYSKRRARSDV